MEGCWDEQESNKAIAEVEGKQLPSEEFQSSLCCEGSKKLGSQERCCKGGRTQGKGSNERVEYVVEKFEEEVEYEGVMEEMWLNMQADEESWEMEQRKQDFQVECHKAQLEDEVWLLKGRVWCLEGELKIAHAENEYALLKKQDEMDGIVEGMPVELKAEHREELSIEGGNVRKSGGLLMVATNSRQAAVSPSEAMLLACEDMLKEADQ
ncbi:unnamed protein product [Sphagnum jensenii]|uniref:Uncharacterized protein n=1 Tax=Sphagnum jensenii TaxID=128206 RepID=A0ABP1A4W7_9BRYO